MRARIRAAAAALLTSALYCLAATAACSAPVGDILPFRLLHGRPPRDDGGALARLWSEGGRLKLRIGPAPGTRRFAGVLTLSGRGVFKDVRPLSESLLVRMPRPGALYFDGPLREDTQGFDVALAGDFAELTIDLRLDGERRPGDLAIGERAERPAGLPAQLNLQEVEPGWLERFGFR